MKKVEEKKFVFVGEGSLVVGVLEGSGWGFQMRF
jgi:hypothetical protein